MFCAPFLGSESLPPESRNHFYGGLEVTSFMIASTSKIDVGRLASNRQCNHILTLQQESIGSFSRVAGMWHAGAKEPVGEQAFNGPKPAVKTLDVVKQCHRAPKFQFFAQSKPSAPRVKPSVRNFEEQLAVLERMQLLRKAVDVGEEAQVTHMVDIDMPEQKGDHLVTARGESRNHAVESPRTSFQHSLEKQFHGVNPSALQADHSQTGLMKPKHSAEADLTCRNPVWNEPFVGGHGEKLFKNHAVPPSDGNKQMLSTFGINGSHHKDEFNVIEGEQEIEELQIKQLQTDGFLLERDLNESMRLDNEDLCTQNLNILKHYQSLSRESRAPYPLPEWERTNRTSLNGFPSERQEHGGESPRVGEGVLALSATESMQAKEHGNYSTASCDIPPVRMPVYRTSNPLQRSLSDTIFYLESLGVDCSRLFRKDPTAMTCTVKQLRTLVCALERYGLKCSDLGRLFNLCPKLLHVKPDSDLRVVTSFLFDEVRLPRRDFGKVIRRCPRLLVADIQEQLLPTLRFLHSLGYSKMGQVVSNNPTLLSFSVEWKLLPKLRFLESLGFTYREAASMVVRFPAIFNYSVSDNLQPKYDYLVHEIGGRNKDLLAFPQYFGYSLETRIRPRYERIAKLDLSLSIQALLKLSEAEFNFKFPPSGGNKDPYKLVSVLPETEDVILQDCSHELVNSLCCEHPEVRVLVSV